MTIYTEKSFDIESNYDIFGINENTNDIITEDTKTATYLIKTSIYPRVEKILDTPEGSKRFTNLVADYINRNSAKLTTAGPMYLVPFTDKDKAGYFALFNITPNEIKEVVNEVTKSLNANANFLFLRQNPIYVLFYCVIRYYTLKKDSKKLNDALIITSLAYYPSIFDKYYKFNPNQGIMQYTIDNLSQRFLIKKTKHIFGTLVQSIQGSWKFHEKFFYDASDAEVVRFIQRIRNDQNSLMKKIKANYMENAKKGLTVTTQVDSFDDEALIVDNENDTNKVETLTNKIVMAMILNGVDLRICDFSSSAANVSKIDLRNYLSNIVTEKNSNEMKSIIESMLFIYLYDEKHTFNDINTKEFLSFALALFKKTNSKNENIGNIKNILNKWGEKTQLFARFTRNGTRNDYMKGFYLYFILSIQKYN